MTHWIAGKWVQGEGERFFSENPATGQIHWQGNEANEQEIDAAVKSAKESLRNWASLSFDERTKQLRALHEAIETNKDPLAKTISEETGKPLWESRTEVTGLISKWDASISAYLNRTGSFEKESLFVSHRPRGVIAIFSPFNFPAHLLYGQLLPALMAGNSCMVKGSEKTPKVTELLMQLVEKSSLPQGIVNMIQGGGKTGALLSANREINALLFTGSVQTGRALASLFANRPETLLALEMGGCAPLVVAEPESYEAAAWQIVQSAFLTTGQRCTSARRLIVLEKDKKPLLESLVPWMKRLHVGPFDASPEPYIGPLISNEAAEKVLENEQMLINLGGQALVPLKKPFSDLPFLTPGLIQMEKSVDEEFFGPLLQLIVVSTFNEAIEEANATRFGLAASLLSSHKEWFSTFHRHVQAGVINWNLPTTGASGLAPFGGVGWSGNARPAGYYTADLVASPITSSLSVNLQLPDSFPPGVGREPE